MDLQQTSIGLELGSTRIKAVLIGPDFTVLAQGNHPWENKLEDGYWTYSLEDVWGGVQAACLAVITVGTLVYTLFKKRIKTHEIRSMLVCVVIGLMLGIMSSFLGIGGGPINLVVLYFFFSMDTKTAAANSLYIILFSQITSLVTTLVTRTVPEFQLISLVVMVAGGIGGGIVGRKINKKIDGAAVEKLFICLMAVIIAISIWNTYRYLVLGG